MKNDIDKKKDHSLFGNILGITVLVLFLGGIAAILYFKDKNETLCIFIFGAIFFLLGTAILIYIGINKKNLIALLFPIVGACIMFFSGAYMWGSEHIKSHIMLLIPAALLAVFILVGLGIIIVTFLSNRTKKIHCTETVNAVCVRLSRRYSFNRTHSHAYAPTYAPVFNYWFSGKEYTVTESYYTNIDVPKLDSEVQLYINPDNPEEFYRPSFWVSFTLYGMGILFTICGAAALFAYIQKFR